MAAELLDVAGGDLRKCLVSGDAVARVMTAAFGNYLGGQGAYRVSGVGRLPALRCPDALEKDDENLSGVNKPLAASARASAVTHGQAFISCTGGQRGLVGR